MSKWRNLDRFVHPDRHAWSLRNHLSDYWLVYALVAFVAALVAFVAALLVWVVWVIHAQNVYNELHHCESTSQMRTYITWLPMSYGKTTILMPQNVTETLYQCDNGSIRE